METFTTDAINIKTYPLSENDNIVVMFSKDYGLIRGIAKGVRRPKSKLGARMQSLVANKLMLDKGRNLDVIKEASALNPFNKLRGDLDKLTMALYTAETINTFCGTQEEIDDTNKEIYELLYLTLENIQKASDKKSILLAVIKFQIKFMQLAGFGIELKRCLVCSKEIKETALFSIEAGGVVCYECRKNEQYIRLHLKIRDFLVEILTVPIGTKTKYDDIINEQVSEKCFELLKKYIEKTSSKKSKALKVLEATKVS